MFHVKKSESVSQLFKMLTNKMFINNNPAKTKNLFTHSHFEVTLKTGITLITFIDGVSE